ncbi:UNVERIFIED_ORG: hypothetical protein HNP28_002443 [Comamonas terrigena]
MSFSSKAFAANRHGMLVSFSPAVLNFGTLCRQRGLPCGKMSDLWPAIAISAQADVASLEERS